MDKLCYNIIDNITYCVSNSFTNSFNMQHDKESYKYIINLSIQLCAVFNKKWVYKTKYFSTTKHLSNKYFHRKLTG